MEALGSRSNWNLEVNLGNPEKNPRSKARTNNKLNPHEAASTGIEFGSQRCPPTRPETYFNAKSEDTDRAINLTSTPRDRGLWRGTYPASVTHPPRPWGGVPPTHYPSLHCRPLITDNGIPWLIYLVDLYFSV